VSWIRNAMAASIKSSETRKDLEFHTTKCCTDRYSAALRNGREAST